MRTRLMLIPVLLLTAVMTAGTTNENEQRATTNFRIDYGKLDTTGRNLFVSITPGDFLRLEGVDEDGVHVVMEVTVTPRRKRIRFYGPDGQIIIVPTRVIEEREWEDNELVESSQVYMARCTRTDNIYVFGQDVQKYENGIVVSKEGSWRAGSDNAQPGLFMPGTFLLGARYAIEQAPDHMDRATNTDMELTVQTPIGKFEDCIEIVESSPLSPGEETVKMYAPDIGLIADDVMMLVDYSRANKKWNP